MASVAIVGAGELGGTLAHKLASRHRVDEIRLIDPTEGIAAGKALDIQQSAPLEVFGTRLAGTSDLWAAAGARVVVLADAAGSPPAEWHGESALMLLKRLVEVNGEACFVCAGASQRALIGLGVREARIDRRRLVGSAPMALASALRALVALEADAAPADVALEIVGLPPDHLVVAWSAATLHGAPLAEVVSPPGLVRLRARVPHLWPPGPYGLASAASRVCEGLTGGGARRTFVCFLSLDAEFGARGRVAAAPVRLGPRGVERILDPALSAAERVQLENALAVA